MSEHQHIAVMLSYVDDVLRGRKPACRQERAACKRFRRDLRRSDFDYFFDEARAVRAIGFIEKLPHTKGKWAKSVGRERLIRLEPWQKFIVGNLFGWVFRETKLRRFREAYLKIPRKNGKSLLAAGIGIYMLVADGEFGAEVYCGATNEKQAWEVFRPAKQIVERTPALRSCKQIRVNAKSLEMPDGSKFVPVIGKPGDGPSPSCSITDEYHEHPDDTQYDAMITGMGAREQPMAIVITTAGTNIASPCYAMERDVERVLFGQLENERLFSVMYGIDKDDDWTTEAALIKANPNYGVSVNADFLRDQQRDAVQSVRKQNTFKRKHLNMWTGSRDAWLNMELWNDAADASLVRDQFKDDSCYKGLDVASKIDLTADVDIYTRVINGKTHYYVFGKYYIPEDALCRPADGKERKNAGAGTRNDHYYEWVAGGYLIATDGNVIDYDEIESGIADDATKSELRSVGYDQYNASQCAQRLQDRLGLPMIEVPQTTKYFSPAMKEIEVALTAGRLHHDGNPVLAWCVSNVTAKEDANENVFPRKEARENKIDGAVAMIIAMALAHNEEAVESNEISQGFVVL